MILIDNREKETLPVKAFVKYVNLLMPLMSDIGSKFRWESWELYKDYNFEQVRLRKIENLLSHMNQYVSLHSLDTIYNFMQRCQLFISDKAKNKIKCMKWIWAYFFIFIKR